MCVHLVKKRILFFFGVRFFLLTWWIHKVYLCIEPFNEKFILSLVFNLWCVKSQSMKTIFVCTFFSPCFLCLHSLSIWLVKVCIALLKQQNNRKKNRLFYDSHRLWIVLYFDELLRRRFFLCAALWDCLK